MEPLERLSVGDVNALIEALNAEVVELKRYQAMVAYKQGLVDGYRMRLRPLLDEQKRFIDSQLAKLAEQVATADAGPRAIRLTEDHDEQDQTTTLSS